MSALIGALRVSLSADTANFEAGMKRAQRSTSTSASAIQKSMGLIKASLAGLAAGLSIGAIIRAGAAALEYASHLTELAETLGLTSKDLQTFSYAAGQVGISQEELEVGIQKLTISMGKAQLGASAQAKAFNAIGISVDGLKGKDTGEVFRMIAEKLQNVSDRSQRAAVEVALFGKAGAKLDNLLSGAEGRLSELSDAAEKLGIVLSDEQIKNADQTADKIKALKTVLEANIAGAVADNAGAILDLANALATLVRSIGQAMKGWRILKEEFQAGPLDFLMGTGPHMDKANAIRHGGIAYGVGSVTMKLPPATPPKGKSPTGGDVGQFLAGNGPKAKANHSAEDALRNAYQFDQELRRAQMDVLQATRDLATDYVERTSIGIDILNAEKAAFEAEQQYQVALFKLTKGKEGESEAQSAQLKAEFDKADALKRQALLEEEQAQKRQDIAMLVETDFDTQKNKLQSELQLARTAKEQRDIQLQLLDLSYRQERARLEAVIADEKASEAAKEDARRRLLGLDHTYANDRQGVINSTMGPLDQYFSQVPKTVAETQEAMERLKVEGIDSAINGIIALTQNFKDWRNIALQSIQSVLAELLRMQLMKLALNLFGGAAGGGFDSAGFASTVAGNSAALGIPGFAKGGSGTFGGRGGTDRAILSVDGLPIARVSRGEPWAIGADAVNGIRGGGPIINFHVSGDVSRETMNQIAVRTRGAIAAASRGGF